MAPDDLTAPIGKAEVNSLANSESCQVKQAAVAKILSLLNEKRDAYNGLISTMIYMIETRDDDLIRFLQDGLIDLVAFEPVRYGGKMFVFRCIPRLIMDQAEFVGDLFSKLMRVSREVWEPRFKSQSGIVRVKITALRAICQAEQRTRTKLSDIDQSVIDEVCDQAVRIADETTKVETLYLVLDTKVTTKVIEERDLEIFKSVFKDALNFQVPALRQKFMAITNKLMRRMTDSTRAVIRDKVKYSDDDRERIVERYSKFLSWLVQHSLDNIYCNKYFGSFIITMSTLHYIIEHITLDNPNLPIAHLFRSRRFYDSILSCVSLDSFEENKIMALKLLFALPTDEQYTFIRNLQSFEEMAYELVSSVNPAHSLTCQYIFKLVIGFRQRQTNLRKNQLVYQHLDRLIGLVEVGVRETKKNFISALKTNAIYPKLTCIRALLGEIDMNDLKFDREKWELLAMRIVDASIEACQAISLVVCNMNPETIGHMPMDLKPLDAETLSKTYDVSVTISKDLLDTITSQHLLITGWKTIKECSLSMAAMCSQLWWPKNDKSQQGRLPILDSRAIKKIINFFEHYLRNLRHRGAFEQAYNGFVMVTKRIWLQDEFRDLLTTSLTEIMNDFSREQEELGDKKVEYLKKHITRRSAGLPFLVQAIVVSEDKKESKVLQWAIKCLLDILEDSKAEAYQKVHCLNILKALMKDYNLGEKVIPFIERTMIITIDSFKSENFSIRNCANMLMRVVVDRTFGVNRLRDDIHKRNTLSFEKFFTEYPQIHSNLVRYLAEGLQDKSALAAVHAVFIILYRLRPSINPSPDYALDKAVAPFIEPITQLAHTCPDYHLRELASNLSVQLESYCIQATQREHDFITKAQLLSEQIVSSLGCNKIDRDRIHGDLCMFRSWLDRCKTFENLAEIQSELLQATERVVLSTVTADEAKFGLASSTLKMIAMDVAESYCLLFPDAEHIWLLELFPTLKTKLTEAFEATDESQLKMGPHFENLIFKLITSILTSGCVPGKDLASFERELLYEDLCKLIVDVITRPPNRIIGLNIQAALVRMLRQFFSEGEDFVDKLLDNLDLDATAALMTPLDKLASKCEMDFEYERWSKFCRQTRLRTYIRESIPNELLDRMFDLYRYEEFKRLGEDVKSCTASESNTPRSVELLAFVCKAWVQYDLENRCVWIEGEDGTTNNKLRTLSHFTQVLPDCDIKCLLLKCTSNLFNTEIMRAFEQDTLGVSDQLVDQERRISSVLAFTEVLESLADGDRGQITRETSAEVLRGSLRLAIDCWCPSLKDALINLFSTLIKLSQDEDFDIRQCSTCVLASLSDEPDSSSVKLGSLLRLISTKLLDPTNDQDLVDFFNLMARIIFNHSKNYTINFRENKESLFDKTKPNVFADHVASIQDALCVAKEFFQKAARIRGNRLSIGAIQLSPEVVAELEILDIKSEQNVQVGDYSWRFQNSPSSPRADTQRACDDNSALVDRCLHNINLSLDYFKYRNMLLDTTFGYHESTIFKRLAFVRLLIESTDYDNQNLVAEIREKLDRTINESCATTILMKSRETLSS